MNIPQWDDFNMNNIGLQIGFNGALVSYLKQKAEINTEN